MDNKMEIFNNEEFGSVRIVKEGDKIFFCGVDAAKALGYKDTVNALKTHCREDGVAFYHLTDNLGRQQKAKFINEGNLYRLICHSKLPNAERFEAWVFEQVLPSIRKYGGYMTPETARAVLSDYDLMLMFAEGMLEANRRTGDLQRQLDEITPKAEFYDTFVHPEDCTNIRAAAKELRVPERAFCKFLQDAGYLYRSPAGNLMPYAKHTKAGLFVVKDFYSAHGHYGAYTLFTPKGKDLIRKLTADLVV